MNKEEKEEYLQNIYYNPENAGSFSGPDKLYRFIQKDGKKSISFKDVKMWIQSQEVYTTNRLVKQKIERRKVIVPYIDYMWDIDTASLRNYSDDNDGIWLFPFNHRYYVSFYLDVPHQNTFWNSSEKSSRKHFLL